MSFARDNLISRIEAIQTTLNDPISIDTTPVPIPSSAAIVVRNGCTVMLFCALESFIRDRSLECAQSINQLKIPYTHLSNELKYASLISTFEGLAMATRGWQKIDKIQEFEKSAVAVSAGFLGSPYQFTAYSFARDKSNVTVEDISMLTKTFGVENFWQAASGVCGKAGIAIPSKYDELFRLLAKERHKAAHVAQHNVSHSWISSALFQTISIAIAFDTLISTATYKLNTFGSAIPVKISDGDVDFYAVKPHKKGWAAYKKNTGRASFVEANKTSALARAISAAQRRDMSVVCHDAGGRVVKWSTVLG